jgi:hypothetical protein
LAESDKEREAKQTVDPIKAFLKIIAATINYFLLITKICASQQNLQFYRKLKGEKFYKKPSVRTHHNVLLGPQTNLRHNENREFVKQILLQPGLHNLCT